ncbi:hypothetical protein CEXT_27361 [Caerostris extrusa]|uniref:Uncharacterized protein n=1 Tax=Caerostris extrusa TaxID=172846 RepID=A0AAV4X0V6_CAEEX|nr:hypothetical protein CEXT_27361 [Caerostris extrusa]
MKIPKLYTLSLQSLQSSVINLKCPSIHKYQSPSLFIKATKAKYNFRQTSFQRLVVLSSNFPFSPPDLFHWGSAQDQHVGEVFIHSNERVMKRPAGEKDNNANMTLPGYHQ